MVTKTLAQRETAPANGMYANSVGEVFCQPCSLWIDTDLEELDGPEDFFCENCHPPTTPKWTNPDAYGLAQTWRKRAKKGKA